MPTINEVCDDLAAVVSTISGLRALGYADDQINPPQAHVFTRDFDPRMTMGGSASRPVPLGVRVFVRAVDPRSAQKALRAYMEQSGSTSIRAAIENDTLWSETVHYAEVTNIGQLFLYEAPGETFHAVDFDVDVIW